MSEWDVVVTQSASLRNRLNWLKMAFTLKRTVRVLMPEVTIDVDGVPINAQEPRPPSGDCNKLNKGEEV